jgi:hypothetical protein
MLKWISFLLFLTAFILRALWKGFVKPNTDDDDDISHEPIKMYYDTSRPKGDFESCLTEKK